MKMKKLNRICPICGSDNGNTLGIIKMALGENVKLPKEYDIVACINCGFTFADTESLQDDYNEYYASDNCYAYDGEIKSSSMLQSVKHTTDFFQKYVGKCEKILDIGCGSGDFLMALKEKGYENLFGIDPSQDSVDRLVNAGIRGIKKNIFDVWEDGEMFDVIVSTCVLEHIRDLDGFLRISLSHLKDNGKIFIVVPAVEGFEKYYQSKANYFNHEHINYFSKISLANILGEHGCVSMNKELGEFYVIEQQYGAKDMMLQNVFCYKKIINYRQMIDEISKRSITNYLTEYKKEEERIFEIVEDLSAKRKKCIVFGAGSLSMQLMTNKQFAEKVELFVDNNKEKVGKDIAGKKICSPDVLKDGRYRDLAIVIACMQHNDAIVKQLGEMKVANDLIVY